MKTKMSTVPLDVITVPRSQQRDAYSRAGYGKLKE